MYKLSVTSDDYSIWDDGPGTNSIVSAELVAYEGLGGLIGLPNQVMTFNIDNQLQVELTCERNADGKIVFSIMHDSELLLMASYFGPFSMRIYAKNDIDYDVELLET